MHVSFNVIMFYVLLNFCQIVLCDYNNFCFFIVVVDESLNYIHMYCFFLVIETR